MDMTLYDPAEVARMDSRSGDHAALMRFAMHVERRCPTHVWPHVLFARFAADDMERFHHYAAAVRAGEAQLAAERAGQAARRRDPGEAKLFRIALRAHASLSAAHGFPQDAVRAAVRLHEISPAAGDFTLKSLQGMGAIPAQAAETAASMRM